ncbi:acetoacetyl-CoA reductase [Alteriqipengyuania sp. 357]
MPKIAIVTGGTRGIGAATSKALAQNGFSVVATHVSDGEHVERFGQETGIPTYRWDVASYEACQDGVAQIEREHGPVDILVNNAGITRDRSFLKMSQEDWSAVVETNLGGCFNMAKAVFGGMCERKWGRIVNISSINGQAGQFGQANYSAAKAALHGFTKALALEGARKGVTVNVIAPGYIATDMVADVREDVLEAIVARIPIGRLGQPEEIARGVLFLCSEEAGIMTGSTLSMNGGQHMY